VRATRDSQEPSTPTSTMARLALATRNRCMSSSCCSAGTFLSLRCWLWAVGMLAGPRRPWTIALEYVHPSAIKSHERVRCERTQTRPSSRPSRPRARVRGPVDACRDTPIPLVVSTPAAAQRYPSQGHGLAMIPQFRRPGVMLAGRESIIVQGRVCRGEVLRKSRRDLRDVFVYSGGNATGTYKTHNTRRVGSRSPAGWDQIPRWAGGWVLHQPPWSFGFDSQTRGTRENRRTLY
jgi:hypothetical protein